MPISQHEFNQMAARVAAGSKTAEAIQDLGDGGNVVTQEKRLHESIIGYCNSQWPRWKFHHSRMDRASTTEVGECDFTIFMPGRKVLCIECKRTGGKLSEAQRNWIAEMKLLGHEVKVIYSFEAFLDAVNQRITNL